MRGIDLSFYGLKCYLNPLIFQGFSYHVNVFLMADQGIFYLMYYSF